MVQKLFPLILIASAGVASAQSPSGGNVPTPDSAPTTSVTPPAVPMTSAPAGAPTLSTPALPTGAGPAPSLITATGNPLKMGPNASRFTALDRNHNGTLSLEEMNAIPASAASKSSANRFSRMDTNHDGKISQAEYAAAEAAMVSTGDSPNGPPAAQQ